MGKIVQRQITFTLLFVLVVVYLMSAMMIRTEAGAEIYSLFVLDPQAVVQRFQVWRLLTYALLHDLSSPMHLLFNGMLFFFLAPEMEDRWGEKRFALFVFLTALGGGIFVVLAWLLGISYSTVIGFSAVSIGVLVAWGLTFPTRQLLLFGIIPVSGQNMVLVTVGMEVLYAISTTNVSSAAHFGGMAVAFALVKGLWRPKRWKVIH